MPESEQPGWLQTEKLEWIPMALTKLEHWFVSAAATLVDMRSGQWQSFVLPYLAEVDPTVLLALAGELSYLRHHDLAEFTVQYAHERMTGGDEDTDDPGRCYRVWSERKGELREAELGNADELPSDEPRVAAFSGARCSCNEPLPF